MGYPMVSSGTFRTASIDGAEVWLWVIHVILRAGLDFRFSPESDRIACYSNRHQSQTCRLVGDILPNQYCSGHTRLAVGRAMRNQERMAMSERPAAPRP